MQRLQDPIESQPPRVGDLAPNEEPFSGLFIEQKTTRGERGSKMISKNRRCDMVLFKNI